MDSVQLILATAVLGLAILLVVFSLQGKKVAVGNKNSPYRKPTFLLVGANGAGKTSIFYKLQGIQPISTVSSLEANYGKIAIPFSNPDISKEYQFIDWPGHLKYSQLLRKLITEDVTVQNVKGVIFVIDSSSASLNQDKIAAIAKLLYDLLSITEKTPMGVDYLFAINKQDLFDTKPVFKVKSLVEQEVSKLVQEELHAKGSARGGSGIDNDDEEEGFSKEESTREFWKSLVGSRPFKFEILEGNMEFLGGSALKNKLSDWQNWFDEKAMNYGGM